VRHLKFDFKIDGKNILSLHRSKTKRIKLFFCSSQSNPTFDSHYSGKKNVHVRIRNWVRPRSTKKFPRFLLFFPWLWKNSRQKSSGEQCKKNVSFGFYVWLVARQKMLRPSSASTGSFLFSSFLFQFLSIAFINRFHFIFSSNEKVYLTFTFIAIGVHDRVSPSKK
jgi:hypothetical protein